MFLMLHVMAGRSDDILPSLYVLQIECSAGTLWVLWGRQFLDFLLHCSKWKIHMLHLFIIRVTTVRCTFECSYDP